jgi:hypothetical protein
MGTMVAASSSPAVRMLISFVSASMKRTPAEVVQ